jgi:hypothetical protein
MGPASTIAFLKNLLLLNLLFNLLFNLALNLLVHLPINHLLVQMDLPIILVVQMGLYLMLLLKNLQILNLIFNLLY